MKKVLIITRLLPQYRIDFINRLKTNLAKQGVELSYVYGKSENQDALKKDEVDLSWGTYIPNKTWTIKGMELVWQPCLSHLDDKDLIIVEQANRNLIVYFLIFRRLLTKKKFAFWGHGRNMQAAEDDWRNSFKTLFLRQCDWWFAYTQKVKELLMSSAFPADRITCVQNAIDTKALSQHYDGLTEKDTAKLKQELGIDSNNTVIYCGGIYQEKRIPFLLEACDKIREQVKDLQVIVIGSGPDAGLVREAALSREWLHYVGPKFGLERVKYFKISAATLMPGLVGLAILDSFAMQTPMITTEFPFHSPEIEYLKNGENGIITENTLEGYVAGVLKVLQNESVHQRLIEGCREAAGKYTVDQMVENFSAGVLQALDRSTRKQKKEKIVLSS
jgi:glycosyltransferase involved in cell wall biosynthesis